MPTVLRLSRLSILAIMGILVVVALWVGVWTLAAGQFRSSIDGWIVTGRAEGNTILYDDRELFGFPHHVVLRFTNVNWKNAEGIAFHADQMDLSSLPWDREVFDARFRGHAEIAAPLDADGKNLMLSGESGSAHVVLSPDGVWKFTRVSLMQAKWGRAPDFLFQTDRLEASAQRPKSPPKTHTEIGLTVTADAANVTLPASMTNPFGPKMAMMEASMRVMGVVPDFRRKDSVAVWNNDSGVVEFDSLHMNWGPLRLEAKGTIGFDDDLQPEGAFSSAIGNHGEVLKALMENGFIPQRRAAMLNSALNVFAKKSSGGESGIEVPITIQLGGLFLGPVRIFVFPEIQWPRANPAPTPG